MCHRHFLWTADRAHELKNLNKLSDVLGVRGEYFGS